MKNQLTIIILALLFTQPALAQMMQLQKLNQSDVGKISLGAYAQIDYNQPISSDIRQNGKIDVHRLVMTMGYKFNKRTKFFTEIEYEHVKEVYIEQAFLSYKINDFINFKGGLVLIPMGIINERHEPNIFNGVERPNVDKYIIPTTWREVGAGFTGRIDDASLKYQIYLVNGFNGYDGSAKLNGSNGLRKGRQKGAESYISAPNLSAKVDYYGFGNLKLGLATYLGNTQSTLYNGLDKNDEAAIAAADSSVVGIRMVGADAQYTKAGWQARGQYILTSLSNTEAYNAFGNSDVGKMLTGYYVELGYDVLHNKKVASALIPFARYEHYNTHAGTDEITTANKALNKTELIFGLGWKPASGAIVKGDYQIIMTEGSDSPKYQLNFGVGLSF
ncbi:MAG: hypothetical protein DWQ02_19565 [Bacteroidetes bacterium]|nr:MAG: hypothetical protein DWQ02_19565 [Bacteroidota bacterium]